MGRPKEHPLALPPSLAVIYRALLERDRVTREQLHRDLSKAGVGVAHPYNVSVRVWRLQRRLGRVGIIIRLEGRGRGWYIDRETRRRLLNEQRAAA